MVSDCVPENICLTNELLLKFYRLVGKVGDVIDTITYTAGDSTAKSLIVSKMNAYARMNDFTYVRFMWMKRHQNFQFDPNNMTSRWDLYYYYQEIGSDKWKYDPLTNSLPGVVV